MQQEFIDLRSDTVTTPTEEMLEAMRTARVLGIGYIIKKKNFYKGLMYGVGHGGGGEAMVFVGLSLAVNYIIFRFFSDI
ncbi:MAG: YhfC family intramembrane metalloprotease, partial [Actinobacteria bacterium]|nr:YhfC family intramembrane metalloprotease [Actinomycetota bacterium]